MVAQGNALAHQQLATMMQLQDGLLFRPLGPDKPHARPLYRLTDGFRIIAVALVGLQVRFHKGWCHHANSMPQLSQCPGPIMGATAGLHANQAG